MIQTGWIKIHRKIQQSPLYLSLTSKQRDVLIQCLLLANHTPKEWLFNGELYVCQEGEFITSLASLQKLCARDVTQQNIRTSLVVLEKWQFLTSRSTNKNRLIKVLQWQKYQCDENETNKQINKQLTSNQQATNKQLTTNKKIRNKEIKKEGETPAKKSLNFRQFEKIFNEKSELWVRLVEKVRMDTKFSQRTVEKELSKFHDYWSEPNDRGKGLWETKPVFDVMRRIMRWFDKVHASTEEQRQVEQEKSDRLSEYNLKLIKGQL